MTHNILCQEALFSTIAIQPFGYIIQITEYKTTCSPVTTAIFHVKKWGVVGAHIPRFHDNSAKITTSPSNIVDVHTHMKLVSF